jgi:hypothetical protein
MRRQVLNYFLHTFLLPLSRTSLAAVVVGEIMRCRHPSPQGMWRLDDGCADSGQHLDSNWEPFVQCLLLCLSCAAGSPRWPI